MSDPADSNSVSLVWVVAAFVAGIGAVGLYNRLSKPRFDPRLPPRGGKGGFGRIPQKARMIFGRRGGGSLIMKKRTGEEIEEGIPVPEGVETFQVVCGDLDRLAGTAYIMPAGRWREQIQACVHALYRDGKAELDECRTFDAGHRLVAQTWLRKKIEGKDCP
jgi:hypothetical protein